MKVALSQRKCVRACTAMRVHKLTCAPSRNTAASHAKHELHLQSTFYLFGLQLGLGSTDGVHERRLLGSGSKFVCTVRGAQDSMRDMVLQKGEALRKNGV